MTDDHLQRFARKVVELQEKRRVETEQRVDEELMREVALDLGMSEEELVRIKEESRAHKERARALRSSGNLELALEELETAWTFNPLDVEVMYLLADALFTRSQRKGDDAEWSRARDLCRKVLEAAPAHAEAPALMNAIENKAPEKRPRGVPVGVVVGIGLALLALGIALAVLLL
jgi:tetratricopeptide (TPR) repeat protein